MSLYKRGDVWHYDFTVNGTRYRGTTGFKKKQDATEYVERERRALKLGKTPDRAPVTLGKAADSWFASRAARLKSATTIAQRLKILLRHMEPTTLVRDIGPRDVEAAMMRRRVETTRQGKLPTASTVNRDMIDTTLRPILSYAEEVLEEPVRKIKWAKLRMQEPRGRTRSFTPEEIAAWRDRLPEHHRAVYDFIARYGVRLNEAFFSPEAVNIEAAEIILGDTKNGTHHTLVIDEDDLADLAARKSRAIAAGLPTVWFSEDKDGLAPIHWRGFQSASKAALVAAGIADAKPVHDLRHHAATTLMRSTGNLKVVQDLLNHRSIVSSARYAHTSKDDLREALRHTYGTKAPTVAKKASKIKDA